ncbi:MAG: imelysin family protein, partial [Myxococcota bacterium]
RDLRDHIYSWPNANPCRVDQETFERTYEDPTLLQAETVDAKGLDALEYLLFHEGSDNACPSLSTINESGNWDALSAEQKLQRRADYAEAASGLVHGRAQELLGAWEPEGENFLHELSEAGLESTVYGTSQEALNAVSDGLFYVDTDTKDMKVGEPAGIVDCLNEVCPAALESDFARRSKEHVLNNLHGFALVFRGGPGDEPTSEGIDDLLTDLGPDAATLATQMNTELDEAIAAVEAVDGTFYDALTTDPTPVRTAHEAIRDLTTLYKSQFLALLDLSPPASAPADND